MMTNMNREYFQGLLDARPFVPFTVQLSSGVVHAVRYPRDVILTRSLLAIGDPDAEKIVVCSLLHVVKVEMLSGSPPAESEPVGPAA